MKAQLLVDNRRSGGNVAPSEMIGLIVVLIVLSPILLAGRDRLSRAPLRCLGDTA